MPSNFMCTYSAQNNGLKFLGHSFKIGTFLQSIIVFPIRKGPTKLDLLGHILKGMENNL